MTKINKSIIINAPIEKVYDYILHGAETGPIFIPNLMTHENISPETPDVGQTWDWTFNMLGVDLKGKAEITMVERNKKWEMKTSGESGSVTSTWLYTFTPEGSGTKVAIEIGYEIPQSVLAKVANVVLVERVNEKNADEGLANLKLILET